MKLKHLFVCCLLILGAVNFSKTLTPGLFLKKASQHLKTLRGKLTQESVRAALVTGKQEAEDTPQVKIELLEKKIKVLTKLNKDYEELLYQQRNMIADLGSQLESRNTHLKPVRPIGKMARVD